MSLKVLSNASVATSTSIVGPPTTGIWLTNQVFIDANGSIWVCSAGGSPGTWVAGGSGVELGEAELSSNFSLSAASNTDITGLTLTFNAPNRPFLLELALPKLTLSASTSWGAFQITDSANTEVAGTFFGSVSATTEGVCGPLRAHLPTTGTNAYPITPGNSYTFKARYAMVSGTGTIVTDAGSVRPVLRAVTC